MNTKIIIASMLVAIVLAALAYFADFYSLFPQPLAIFVTALVGGCFSSYWVCSAEGITAAPAASRRKTKPASNASNNGKTTSANKETGSVKWFSSSKGFGFITRDNGEDVFVHFRSILGKGHRILREGQRVEFAVTEGNKGLQAEDVSEIDGR